MRFYRCDRCKKEFNGNEYLVTEDKLGLVGPDKASMGISFPFDICDDCLKDFENWFRQPMVDKAFEEAHAKAHAHEKNEVTVLGLEDGRCICPVCGYVFDPIKVSGVKLSYKTVNKIEYYKSCPKCGSLFSDNINYINLKKEEGHEYVVRNEYEQSRKAAEEYRKREGGEVDDTTRTEN